MLLPNEPQQGCLTPYIQLMITRTTITTTIMIDFISYLYIRFTCMYYLAGTRLGISLSNFAEAIVFDVNERFVCFRVIMRR